MYWFFIILPLVAFTAKPTTLSFWSQCSAEIALIKGFSNFLFAKFKSIISILISFGLSAAFNTPFSFFLKHLPCHDLESSLLPSQDLLFICPIKSNFNDSHHRWVPTRCQTHSSFNTHCVPAKCYNSTRCMMKYGNWAQVMKPLPKVVERRSELMRAWARSPALPKASPVQVSLLVKL